MQQFGGGSNSNSQQKVQQFSGRRSNSNEQSKIQQFGNGNSNSQSGVQQLNDAINSRLQNDAINSRLQNDAINARLQNDAINARLQNDALDDSLATKSQNDGVGFNHAVRSSQADATSRLNQRSNNLMSRISNVNSVNLDDEISLDDEVSFDDGLSLADQLSGNVHARSDSVITDHVNHVSSKSGKRSNSNVQSGVQQSGSGNSNSQSGL